MRLITILILFASAISFHANGQFPPAAGQPGTNAIFKDSSVFVNWASECSVVLGWQNIADTTLGKANVGDSSMACGQAGTNGVVSLGDGGMATLTFTYPIKNGPYWDFAVFENSFLDTFLELAFVEVSSDGINFFRFPSTSLTDTLTQIDAFGSIDPTKINNLAGKYRVNYGTPFNLDELAGNITLDIFNITHIRLIDVIGSINEQFASFDSFGHIINDPWPTPFNSSGFDLDAVGVIHQNTSAIKEKDARQSINIFPNPCHQVLNISRVNFEEPLQISLLDINGKVIKEMVVDSQNITINIDFLHSGIYFLKVLQNNRIEYFKIIKS